MLLQDQMFEQELRVNKQVAICPYCLQRVGNRNLTRETL